ncbi:MAG: putative dienelactone hydrolase [Gemmatimonadetes bacterium]|nr:putative dienelactone hydrolase [Gemmatimonadota bacterium]
MGDHHAPIRRSQIGRAVLCAAAVAIVHLSGCHAAGATADPTPVADTVGNFVVTGDPAAAAGATWTFRGVVHDVTYDLSGVLLKPAGPGPFGAVLLSHGYEGSASFFARLVGPEMVRWGLVCIAVNYTHAAGVPSGEPGGDPGASTANVLRAHMTHELLRRLPYVDMSRVAVHGHSMGAYLDVAAAASYPADFRVGSQTGGGVRPERMVRGPAPTAAQARALWTPYQMHHGAADEVVPLAFDLRLDSLLARAGTAHELHVYLGASHLAARSTPLILSRIHDWYAAHGMF